MLYRNLNTPTFEDFLGFRLRTRTSSSEKFKSRLSHKEFFYLPIINKMLTSEERNSKPIKLTTLLSVSLSNASYHYPRFLLPLMSVSRLRYDLD